MEYDTVENFIKEFRQRIGDTTCSTPAKSIIGWMNTALRRLARSRGLDKLFTYHDTFELARLNEDGTPAASWKIQGLKDSGVQLGMIIDIKSILVLDGTGCCMEGYHPCYMPLDWFRKEHPFPEKECPGIPCSFTINQMNGATQITFDRPIDKPLQLDLIYSAFPPRLTSMTDLVRVPYAYSDILMEAVMILFNQEAQDYAFARANYEDWDFLVAEARELLAKQPSGFPPRVIRGSF